MKLSILFCVHQSFMLFCEVLVHIFCLFSMTFSVFSWLIAGILYICPGCHAPLSVIWVADVFFLFWACLHTIYGVFWWTYALIFSAVEFIIFHETYAFVFLKKSFLTQDHNIILLLLSKSYTVFAFYVQVFNMPKMRFGCGKGICILFV